MFLGKKIFLALTEKERNAFFAALGIAVIAIASLGGQFVRGATVVIPTRGGSYSEGVVGQPSYVNPLLASTNADKTLTHLMFANLEELSEKIDVTNNGKTWKVRLREDLLWSDGEKLTSDDVIFSVEKIKDPGTGSPLLGNWQGVSAKRASQLEITFELTNPYSFFSDNIKSLYILPKHLFADIPGVNWRLSDYTLKPVGNGPYKFVSFEKRNDGFITSYKLEPNPNFFGESAKINTFNVLFFPNAEEAVKAFNSGKLQGLGDMDPKTLGNIKRPYDIHAFDLPSYYAVFWNQSESIPLQDKEVRKALSISTDREKIINESMSGKASAVGGPLAPGLPGIAVDLNAPEFSQSQAEEILETAGWTKREDGLREKTINRALVLLEFELTTPKLPFLISTAENLKSQWESLGAIVNIKLVEPQDELDQTVKNRDYEGILLGNALNPSGDLFSFWHSAERFHPGLNLSIFNNRSADTLIETLRQNFNAESRNSQFEQLVSTIKADEPAVFLFSPSYIYVSTKDLKGAEDGFIAEPAERFRNVESWYLKTTRAFK